MGKLLKRDDWTQQLNATGGPLAGKNGQKRAKTGKNGQKRAKTGKNGQKRAKNWPSPLSLGD